MNTSIYPPIRLFVIGGSLISSNGFWISNSQEHSEAGNRELESKIQNNLSNPEEGLERIEELFRDLDEVSVKQLLLSLHKRLEWTKQTNVTRYISHYSSLIWPSKLSDLKWLKIKPLDSLNILGNERIISLGNIWNSN